MSDADRYPSAMPADITNQEFLTGLFDDDWWRVHVTAFPGDPTIQDGRWAGGLARDVLADPGHIEMNCYSEPSPLSPAGSPRQIKYFEAMHVIVLDDVGPKVKLLEAVPAMGMRLPTYAVETSKNNVQCGWRMTPQSNFAQVKGMLAKLRKYLGAGDNLTNPVSYFRLPVGRNWKPTDGAQGWRVRPWEPANHMRLEITTRSA